MERYGSIESVLRAEIVEHQQANDALQRALDAERERVAKLEKIQAIDLKNNNEYREQLATLQAQLAALRQERDEARHSRDVFKSQMIAHMNDRDSYAEDLATLQAQDKQLDRTLVDVYQQRDGLQAQLRQVEGERDALKLVNETHMKTVMKLSSIIEKSSTLAQDAGKK